MRSFAGVIWTWLAAISMLALPARGAVDPDEVEKAIKKGIEALYRIETGGNWEGRPGPHVGGHTPGGYTAIATYALLAAGESPQDPRLKSAVDFLKASPMTGTYARALRCQVWTFFPRDPQVYELMKKDAAAFITGAKAGKGLFNYTATQGPGDKSNSQYGVLGLWACAELGAEVPEEVWLRIADAWLKSQYDDGSWAYNSARNTPGQASTSMTAAGIATLFIAQDMVANEALGCARPAAFPGPEAEERADKRAKTAAIIRHAIDVGMAWMSEEQHIGDLSRFPNYTLYGIERIGVASGRKYFGTVDWYQTGAERALATQAADGTWDLGLGEVADTSFALLFLVRGRAPVVMNKLEFEVDLRGDKVKPFWNNRPRDVANVTRYIGRQAERWLNWQIVSLQASVDDLHDAPILYISGNKSLNFNADDMAKLRQFAEQGGIILGNADCGDPGFADSFRWLGNRLFPRYEFRELPATHPIYTGQVFPRAKWNTKPRLMGLSNGARELMLLFPRDDPAKYWQLGTMSGHEELHEIMADIFLYAVERGGTKRDLRYKGQTWIVKADAEISADREIKIARLEYAGNWDPEPGGWRRLSAVMHNTRKTDLAVQTLKLGEGKLTKDFTVAHLTGTGAFKLAEAQRKELRDYVESGGTLIVDACGGDGDFARSAQAELEAIFGHGRLTKLKRNDRLFDAADQRIPVVLRAFGKRVLSIGDDEPRLRSIDIGGRHAVIFSDLDLTVGLVGQNVDGIIGYDPPTATALMSSMLRSTQADERSTTATAPASRAAEAEDEQP